MHIDGGADLARRLRVLAAPDGPLILMRTPGPMALVGPKPRTVAPLLVYAELLQGGEKRAIEAAAEVRRKYLEYLP